MKTATVRIKRIVCLVVAFLLAVSGMGISAHAASQFAIEGKSYELTDGSSFEINENKSQDIEDGDINPIWGFAEHAIIGVKQHRNQHKSQQNLHQLDTPVVFLILEKQSLNQRKE